MRKIITALSKVAERNSLAAAGAPLAPAASLLFLDWDGSRDAESSAARSFMFSTTGSGPTFWEPVLGSDLFVAYSEILNQCMAPVDHIVKTGGALRFSDQSRKELVAKSLRDAWMS